MLGFASKFVPKSSIVRTYSSTNTTTNYDIVISGHGLVGGTLALAVAGSRVGSKLKVAVVDRMVPNPINPHRGMDTRAISVAPSSSDLLKDIGVWDQITAYGVAPFRQMKVWDSRGTGHFAFSSTDVGLPQMGHIVETNVISRAIWEKMTEVKNIDLITDSDIKTIVPKFHDPSKKGSSEYPDFLEVGLSNGSTISCKTIVGADGANSVVRNIVGFQIYSYDYNRIAVAGTVMVDHNPSTAWQRFLTGGPIAMLPGPGNYSSIVWSTTKANAKEFAELSPEARIERLNRLFTAPPVYPSDKFDKMDKEYDADDSIRTRIARSLERGIGRLAGGTKPVAPVITSIPTALANFPLRLSHADSYFHDRAVLIGDAGHTVHPLAGQGANMGFSDVQVLAEEILRAAENGTDVGSADVLRRYEKARKLPNYVLQKAIDSLQHGFDTDNVPVNYARNFVLAFFNAVSILGRVAITYASGRIGFARKTRVGDRA